MNENEFQFVMDCDVESLVDYAQFGIDNMVYLCNEIK